MKWLLLLAVVAALIGLGFWQFNRSRKRRAKARVISERVRLRDADDALPSLTDLRMVNFAARSQSEAKSRSTKAVQGFLEGLDGEATSEGTQG